MVGEGAAEDEVLWGEELFRGGGFGDGEGGRVDVGEGGEGGFLGLDAAAVGSGAEGAVEEREGGFGEGEGWFEGLEDGGAWHCGGPMCCW